MDETETLTIHYTNHKLMKRNQPVKKRFTSPITIFSVKCKTCGLRRGGRVGVGGGGYYLNI